MAQAVEQQLRRSPIRPLLRQFAAAPFKLAPEFGMDLERIAGIKRVRIIPTPDTGGMVFRAHPDGTIEIGIRSLERLWAFCWIFAAMQRAKERVGAGQFVGISEQNIRLLYWAHKSTHDEFVPFPGDAPRPDPRSPSMQMKLAIEFYLGASGGILFHELAHILRPTPYRHTEDDEGRNKRYNHAVELAADKLAYDYIFTDWRKYSNNGRVLTKRVIMFAIVFTFFLADLAFADTISLESHTHPSPFRRLDQFMENLEHEFPQHKRVVNSGLATIAGFVYAITARLWNEPVMPVRFETPQQVLHACERVFVPGVL